MSDRPFLTMQNSTQYFLELLYDTPKEFENKYGNQHLFGVKVNGADEFVLSQKVGSTVDVALCTGTAGDGFTVEKRRDEKGHYPFFVEKGDTRREAVTPSDQVRPTEDRKEEAGKKTIPNGPSGSDFMSKADWALKDAIKEHEIRKAICIKLAVNKIPEGPWKKTTEKEIIGKFTTLMLIMSDDLALIKIKLDTAENLHHLNAMWTKYEGLWKTLLPEQDFKEAFEYGTKIKESFDKPVEKDQKPVEKPVAQPTGTPSPLDGDDEPLPF
jgi:hypothetical protein